MIVLSRSKNAAGRPVARALPTIGESFRTRATHVRYGDFRELSPDRVVLSIVAGFRVKGELPSSTRGPLVTPGSRSAAAPRSPEAVPPLRSQGRTEGPWSSPRPGATRA